MVRTAIDPIPAEIEQPEFDLETSDQTEAIWCRTLTLSETTRSLPPQKRALTIRPRKSLNLRSRNRDYHHDVQDSQHKVGRSGQGANSCPKRPRPNYIASRSDFTSTVKLQVRFACIVDPWVLTMHPRPACTSIAIEVTIRRLRLHSLSEG